MRAENSGRRLVAEAAGGHCFAAGLGVGGLLQALLVLAQAEALAAALCLAPVERLAMGALFAPLAVLAGAVAARAAVTWAMARLAARAAARAKATLRTALLEHSQRLGPAWLGQERRGELTTLLGRGLDALDGYVSGYLPQAAVTACVPLAVLARLCLLDGESALIVALTLPLIPVFGILVGLSTKDATERQWALLRRLGGHFLDVVQGMPTLRAFGRARAQAETVRGIADAHRDATMRTLRIAFLSALVLELVASLSVALVAVPVGLRLLDGGMTLREALLLLLLAPDAYFPFRVLGSQFHASAEGLAAAQQVSDFLARPIPTPPPRRVLPARTVPLLRPGSSGGIEFDAVEVRYPGSEDTVLRDVSFRVRAGERVALVGPSGGGKSTVLALLLGFLRPDQGRILVDGRDLAELDLAVWRRNLTWVPQRPHLFATSVADNIRLGLPGATPEQVRRAAATAGAEEFIDALPHGFDTVLGERGHGVSAGQRQRIALARACLRSSPVLLLDEPTAGLDHLSEAAFLSATGQLMADRTVIVVAHRPALLDGVDRVLRVAHRQVTETTLRASDGLSGVAPSTGPPDGSGVGHAPDRPPGLAAQDRTRQVCRATSSNRGAAELADPAPEVTA
ncbi:thiol reductant ABC exporter subunit CydD [Kitasatospora sp. RB6PN24]|uniref:thiol reductant ABC exporter subunit CydD n=1 Tax=Kitasatospora humi TaxID=2893891 RepID=UPI001E61AA1D|nr:thiol reductant ABC exporter subunit CydD [Kitasatospora humi]MCC9310102.1 thiol reductant ABC exporter subunit CydD [Kitasatospora humi]